jgi:hypothetical protein
MPSCSLQLGALLERARLGLGIGRKNSLPLGRHRELEAAEPGSDPAAQPELFTQWLN